MCLLAGLTLRVLAQDTNAASPGAFILQPANSPGVYQSTEAIRAADDRTREAAVKAGECQPAEQDPAGHWGVVTKGFQLAVRSTNSIFVKDHPMPVAAILRNTATNTLSASDVSKEFGAIFDVRDASGNAVNHRMTFCLGGSWYGFKDILPRHQVEYDYDLATQYALEPGTYTVRASSSIKGTPGFATVYSGVWEIKVVNP